MAEQTRKIYYVLYLSGQSYDFELEDLARKIQKKGIDDLDILDSDDTALGINGHELKGYNRVKQELEMLARKQRIEDGFPMI